MLREMGLPAQALGWSLFSFNVGVEIGQLLVVVLVASALAALRRRSPESGPAPGVRGVAGRDGGGRVLVRAAGLFCWRGYMSRSIVLGVLLAAGTLSAASAAYQAQAQPKVVESRS